RFAAHLGQAVLHALLHGKLQFALGVIEFALLPEELSLRLLRLRQLLIAHLEYFLQLDQFTHLHFHLGRALELCLPRFLRCDARALYFELRSKFCVLLRQALLESLASGSDQGRRQRPGQSDFGTALWADYGRLCHFALLGQPGLSLVRSRRVQESTNCGDLQVLLRFARAVRAHGASRVEWKTSCPTKRHSRRLRSSFY